MLRLFKLCSQTNRLGDLCRNRCRSFFGGLYFVLRDELLKLDEPDFSKRLAELEADVSTTRKSKKLGLVLVAAEYHLLRQNDVVAREFFVQGLESAQENGNQPVELWCLKNLIHISYRMESWVELPELYRRCDQLFSDLDFIPEKIINLTEQALFVAACRVEEESRQALKVAQKLYEIMLGQMEHEDAVYIGALQDFTRAQLAYRFGQSLEAMDFAQVGLEKIHGFQQQPLGRLGNLHLELAVLMIECALDLGMDTVAREHLFVLREFLARANDVVGDNQARLLAAEINLKFANYPLSTEQWLGLVDVNLKDGNHDFALSRLQHVLREFRRNYPEGTSESLQQKFSECLVALSAKIPEKYRSPFLAGHEFLGRGVRDVMSPHQGMLKLMTLTCELMSMHDIDLLAQKVLKTIVELTHMERGMILFGPEKELGAKAVQGMELDKVKMAGSSESLCLEVARYCHSRKLTANLCDWTSGDELKKVFGADSQVLRWQKIDARSVIVLPFVLRDKALGVIYLDSSLRRPSGNPEETQFLENLATIVAVALSNASTIFKKEQDLVHVRRELNHQQMQLVEKYSIRNFLGVSQAAKRLLEVVEKISESSATVLLTGESGVGKEMVAKTIHYNSPYCEHHFVGVNCAAIPDNLLESVLFGSRKGSFTDAQEDRIGLFQEAHGGTIFLDEIGDMPLSMQVKLLRVLEEGEVLPIGAVEPVKINTRVVCATNRDLDKMVKDGQFRQDLFYRINVVSIHVPSLRERSQDIPLFVQHALKIYAEENNVEPKTVSPEALEALAKYDWPGNIRELINVMFNLSIFVERDRIELKDLQDRPELFQSRNRHVTVESDDPILSLSSKIDAGELTLSDAKHEFERLQILRALRLTSGKITTASGILNMPRPQVSRLIKKYGIRKNLPVQDL